MPVAVVEGARINYQILEPAAGTNGQAMALSPGGRNPLADISDLGRLMAANGYRVLLHDRRNCGVSDVGFDPTRSEFEMWAGDLRTLLRDLGMLPAIIGGSSSGARLALTFALRHASDVRALLLIRVTGGKYAVDRLVEKYYDSNARAAATGGMAAVCETEHFAELINGRPAIRDQLMAMSPEAFIHCMTEWKKPFLAGLDLPLIGTTAADLGSLAMPVCIIPGNDLTHPRERGAMSAHLIPGAELFHVTDIERDIDVTPAGEWGQNYPAMARIFAEFLERRLQSPLPV
jgi:pimeloyl-ACP methyl ester carboxylesterase